MYYFLIVFILIIFILNMTYGDNKQPTPIYVDAYNESLLVKANYDEAKHIETVKYTEEVKKIQQEEVQNQPVDKPSEINITTQDVTKVVILFLQIWLAHH